MKQPLGDGPHAREPQSLPTETQELPLHVSQEPQEPQVKQPLGDEPHAREPQSLATETQAPLPLHVWHEPHEPHEPVQPSLPHLRPAQDGTQPPASG